VSAQPQGAEKGLSPLLAVNFADSLGYTIVMPFLVYLVMQWGGDAIVFSLVSAAFSAFQIMGSPLLGRWSDTWGRKPILLLSEAGSLLSWLLALAAFYVPMTTLMDVDSSLLGKFTLTLPLLLLFVARSLDGLTGGSVSVANAYVADISAPDQLKANFGKLSASANAGEVLGPTLAAVLVGTALGYELPVLAAAAMCFVTVLLIWFRLPDSQPRVAGVSQAVPGAISVSTGRNGSRCDRLPSVESVLTICRLPRIFPLLSAAFLVNLAFSIFYIAMPVYVAQELNWSPQKMALFFAIMSLVMIIVEGPVLRRVSAVVSDVVLISTGGLVLGLGFMLLDTRLDSTVFAAAVLIAIGNGLMWPLLVALLSEKAGEQQGAVQGLVGSSGAIASVIGLLLGGILYGSLQGWLFIVSSNLTFVVMLMALWAKRSESR